MTYEEYLALIDKAANPDTGMEALATLKENGKELFESVNTLTNKVTEHEKRIRDLQDTNMKLFLKVGTPEKEVEPEVDESEELQKAFDAMFS